MTQGVGWGTGRRVEGGWKEGKRGGREEELGTHLTDSFSFGVLYPCRTLLGILKRFIGVTDIATVRFSLPSQLLEPVPNLEYWNYLDRPEAFAS